MFPSFPKSGEMTNRIYSLGTATVVSGCFGYEMEVKWLRECWSKSFDLECSDLDGTVDQTRWRVLGLFMVQSVTGNDKVKWRVIV